MYPTFRRSKSALEPPESRRRRAAKVGFPQGFSMRAEVQLFRQSFVRPVSTNLGRRKPRGLGAGYGERAWAGEADIATGARSTVLDALVACIFAAVVIGILPLDCA